ncbi:YjeF N-terminal domain-containing protein [Leucosporidium creatinivorum]|uniref:NAD(P)H-hydrate epimerase n=1 Tax=Leucosporidium creatinivorum TaxID=106004 RepID=A0A1Y2F5Z9_9BASI|nr:YjeF N-terminal domain-containing protein [Leucosporidium creatinivorum]
MFNPFSSAPAAPAGPRYISAKEAQQIDQELMGSDGAFSLDQLMELAGLAIAQALMEIFPLGPTLPLDANGIKQKRTNERVLVCCGPGNQGGDGLVAARHLYQFGYSPSVFYPKESSGEIFSRLKRQCENLDLPIIAPPPVAASSFPMAPDAQENAFKRALSHADIVLDCVFGFSYKPPPRAPFTAVLNAFKSTEKPIVSVDIPSGWDVEEGKINEDDFTPTALISLTAPKLGVKAFAEEGRTHWLGGRFINDTMNKHYDLQLPFYPGSAQAVDITKRS